MRTRSLLAVVVLVVALAPAVPGQAGTARGPLVAPAASDAAARAAVAALPRATAVNDADANKLFDDLDAAFAARGGARGEVIVSFVAGVSGAQGARLVRRVAPDARVDGVFGIIPALAGALSLAEATRVAALPGVRQIELNRPATEELATATAAMGADAVVNELDVSGSLDGSAQVATTDDVGVAVIETKGFADTHEALSGKFVEWLDFNLRTPTPTATGSHGTHVASIAVGRGPNPAMHGVAPGASLIGVNVNSAATMIAAYEELVRRKDELNVRVVTMSLSLGVATTDATTALERAVDATWDAGIVCFNSAGNAGPRKSTISTPAGARGSLAIGSVLDPNGSPPTRYGFALSDFSSRGPTSDGRVKPDLVAPGESIEAADFATSNGYISKSGTSMASPFAAGAAALMIAADPTLTPDQVRSIMYATAQDWGAPGPDSDYGYGRVQVWHAVAEVLRLQGKDTGDSRPPVVPDHEVRTAAPPTGVFETTFTVRDTGFPVAVTAVADVALLSLEVFDAAGNSMDGTTTAGLNNDRTLLTSLADRQYAVTFAPAAAGQYRVRAVVAPATSVAVDISHSTQRP